MFLTYKCNEYLFIFTVFLLLVFNFSVSANKKAAKDEIIDRSTKVHFYLLILYGKIYQFC